MSGIRSILDRYSSASRRVRFVQVGSADGLAGDPIHELVIRDGWRGILVEPVRHLFLKLKRNYRGAKDLIFENCAIAEEEGERELWRLAEARPGEERPYWHDQLGSFRLDVVLRHEPHVPALRERLICEKVACLSLGQLLRRHRFRKVDVFHVDAEGYDFEIVKQIDFEAMKPGLVLFEHAHLSGAERSACCGLLIEKGYRLVSESEDTLAVREGLRGITLPPESSP
jgi:FkbM family methyltransferase